MDPRHIWTAPTSERKKKPLGWQPKVVLHGQFGTGQDENAGWPVPTFVPPPYEHPKTPWLLQQAQPIQPPEGDEIVVPNLAPPPTAPPVPTFGAADPEQPEQPPIQILSGTDADNPAVAMAAQAEQNRLILQPDDDPVTPPDVTFPGSEGQPGAAAASRPSAGSATADPTSFLKLNAPAIDVSQGRDAVLKAWAPALRSIEAGGGPSARNMAAIILAENGAGQAGQLASGDNNWFSISAVGDRPFQSGAGVGGRFAHYDSPLHSAADFVDLVKNSPRYADAWAQRNAPTEQFIGALAKAGYIVPEPGFPVDAWLRNTSAGADIYDQVVGPGPATGRDTRASHEGDAYDIAFDFNQPYGGAQFNSAIPNHRGVDLVVKGAKDGGRGLPVNAFQGGVVAAVTHDDNGGNGVIIQGPNGLYYRYFHFDAVRVAQGDQIPAGTPIGILGATGSEGFPHVHFEVSKGINGDPMDQLIDPRPYMSADSGLVGTGQDEVRNLTTEQTLSPGVERAQTPAAKSQGLLGRSDAGGGMLLEGTSQVHMRGMQIPLDIAYFDQKGKILAVHTLQPGETGPQVPGAVHTVELAAGTMEQTGTQPGDQLGVGQDAAKDRWWEDPTEQGNIDLSTRPTVQNDDGSVSTVRSAGIEEDGQEILIPTVSDDGRVLSDEEAVQQYFQTQRHLGKFATESGATGYAKRLHEQEAQRVGRGQMQGDRWWEDQQQPEPVVVPVYTPDGTPVGPIEIPPEWADDQANDRGWAGQISDSVQGAARQAGNFVQNATQELSNTAAEAATEVQRRLSPETDRGETGAEDIKNYLRSTPGGKMIDLDRQAREADEAGDPQRAEELRQQSFEELQSAAVMLHMGGRPGMEGPKIELPGGRPPAQRPTIYGPQGEVLVPESAPVSEAGGVRGFGRLEGNSPGGLQQLQAASTAEKEYAAVTHPETMRAAEVLVLGEDPASTAAFVDHVLSPGYTKEAATQATAARIRSQAAVENVQRLQRDVDRLRAMTDADRPVSDIPIEEQLAIFERTLQAATDSSVLDVRVSRRTDEALGRGLNSLQIRIPAMKAQELVDRADAQVRAITDREIGAVPRIDKVLKGEHPTNNQLEQLSQAADRVEAGGDSMDAAAVRARLTPGEALVKAPEGPTLAQQLGDVERVHANRHGAPIEDQARIERAREGVLARIEKAAQQRADEMEVKARRELTPDEVDLAVSEALGAPTVAKANREAIEAAGKTPPPTTVQEIVKQIRDGERVAIKDQKEIAQYWAATAREFPDEMGYRTAFSKALTDLGTHGKVGQRAADELQASFRTKLGESYDKFMSDVQRRTTETLDRTATRREAGMQKLDLDGVRDQARDAIDDIVRAPTNRERDLRTQDLMTLLDDAEIAHGEAGHRLSMQMQAEAVRRSGQNAATLMANVERRNVQSQVSGIKAGEKARAKELADQIRDFVKVARENPHALGTGTATWGESRLSRLREDLMLLGKEGQERASGLRESLYKAGIRKILGKVDDDKLAEVMKAVGMADTPEKLKGLIKTLRQPRMIDYLYEIQFINLLSQPVTHVNNVLSNLSNLAGRLITNPVEVAGDKWIVNRGNRVTTGAEVGAAVRGARNDVGTAARDAWTVMKTGEAPGQSQRSFELGGLAGNREFLTEKFGKAGAVAHVVSSRPLEAMDVAIGQIAYGSAVEQYATRKAAQLLKSGGDHNVASGMTLAEATSKVKANVWDYPDVVKQAGKIRDYTLLRGVDRANKFEAKLAELASLRNPAPGATAWEQVGPFFGNQVMPFFGVPMNYTKQGLDRTVGVPVNVFRMFTHTDPTMRAELFRRATVGASMMLFAFTLAESDNLTGNGPEDPDENRQWRATHQPNSWRVPGTGWFSYLSTPYGIPFAAMAGASESLKQAQKQAGDRALSGVEQALAGAWGSGTGAFRGVLGQSFMQNLTQTYEGFAGIQQDPISGVAAGLTGTASRFISPGLVRFFARVTDDLERDATHGENLQEQIAQRMMQNYPGTRQMLPPRPRVLGDPEQSQTGGIWPPTGLRGVLPLPYQPRSGSDPNNPIVQAFTDRGITIGGPPKSITLTGQRVNLTSDEQRSYRADQGRIIRAQLAGQDPAAVDGKTLNKVLDTARELAADNIMANLSPAELKKRMLATLPPMAGSTAGRTQAIEMLVDLNDKSKHPEFVQADGKTPLGTPSEWVAMKAFIATEGAKPADRRDPRYPRLVTLKKLADANKLMNAWQDPRYDDYERYVVGQLGNNMTPEQWDAFQSGGVRKYLIAGTGPEEWRGFDHIVKLYRTLPAGAPLKAQLQSRAQNLVRQANPAWKGPLAYDEITGRQETGELEALDAAYAQGTQP